MDQVVRVLPLKMITSYISISIHVVSFADVDGLHRYDLDF
jgi:hypothetical protein